MARYGDYIYELNTVAESCQIRLDTDQQTLAGGVVGASTLPFHAVVSKGRRGFGIFPRFIIAERTVGTAPNDKTLRTRVPICTLAAFDALSLGDAVTINGISYAVAAKVPELTR